MLFVLNGNGVPSVAKIIRVDTAPVTAPSAPSSLVGTAASSAQINLSWTDNSSNEDGFRIERCQGAGCSNFAEIGTVGPNAVSYSNTGLAASTTYRYRARAYNGGGNSGYSNTADATTSAPSPPSALLQVWQPQQRQVARSICHGLITLQMRADLRLKERQVSAERMLKSPPSVQM